MKRLVLLIAGVLPLSLTLFGTASASVSNLTMDAKADLSAGKTSAVVTGTIICTLGHQVNISMAPLQSSGPVNATGQGQVTVTCSGVVQAWSVTANLVDGSALKHGPATAIFAAFDSTDNTSFLLQTRGIRL